MSFQQKRVCLALFSMTLLICLSIAVPGSSENVKQPSKVFKGKVEDISSKQLTVGRTSIALPKEIKVIDADGSAIRLDKIKKGDFVVITVNQGSVTIKKYLSPEKIEDTNSLPR